MRLLYLENTFSHYSQHIVKMILSIAIVRTSVNVYADGGVDP